MTAPTIPNTFYPDTSSYSIDEPGGVMRTEVGGGHARYALDWDRGTQRFSVTLMLEQDRFSIWSAFYAHIIKKGSIAFYMPLDSGFGTSMHLANIVPGSYSVARDGVLSIITMTVEAESQSYDMTSADAQSMIDIYNAYGDEMTLLLDRIALFATVEVAVI